MKKMLVITLLLAHCITAAPIVSFKPNPGSRLGDHLVTYIKSKYIAYKHNLEFRVYPLGFFKPFGLEHKEGSIQPLAGKRPIVQIDSPKEVLDYLDTDCILLTHYYTDIGDLIKIFKDNPIFQQEVQAKLSIGNHPQKSNQEITIALHIRKGTGFDRPVASRQLRTTPSNKERSIPENAPDKCDPLKFPPNQYYIDQLNRILPNFSGKPIRVFIFTDDPYTQKIAHEIEKNCAHYSGKITFEAHDNYRIEDYMAVINDLSALAQFDILIRPESSFSMIAQLLGNHSLVIAPKSYEWDDDILEITEINAWY